VGFLEKARTVVGLCAVSALRVPLANNYTLNFGAPVCSYAYEINARVVACKVNGGTPVATTHLYIGIDSLAYGVVYRDALGRIAEVYRKLTIGAGVGVDAGPSVVF
jgi:hypothetical protein